MANNRRGGIIQLQLNGEVQDAKGEFSYDIGSPKRTTINGSDGVHGFTEEPKPAYIEGEITDRLTLDLRQLTTGEDVTVTLRLGPGKTFMLKDAWFVGDGIVQTKEGNIKVRWEAKIGEEVTP